MAGPGPGGSISVLVDVDVEVEVLVEVLVEVGGPVRSFPQPAAASATVVARTTGRMAFIGSGVPVRASAKPRHLPCAA